MNDLSGRWVERDYVREFAEEFHIIGELDRGGISPLQPEFPLSIENQSEYPPSPSQRQPRNAAVPI
jgi:hypothetical protein